MRQIKDYHVSIDWEKYMQQVVRKYFSPNKKVYGYINYRKYINPIAENVLGKKLYEFNHQPISKITIKKIASVFEKKYMVDKKTYKKMENLENEHNETLNYMYDYRKLKTSELESLSFKGYRYLVVGRFNCLMLIPKIS